MMRARVAVWTMAQTVSMAICLTSVVHAQEAVTSFGQLAGVLKPGDRIQVTDASGRKTKGTLRELTTSSLEILVRGDDAARDAVKDQRLSEQDVRTIVLERHDSPLQGALIGFAIGAGPGLVLIIGRERGSDPVQDAATAMKFTLLPGAIGAGIGLLADSALYERRTVFNAHAASSPRVRVSPMLSRSAVGVRVTIH